MVSKGGVEYFEGDAIVNAASGGAIDSAVMKKGGPLLQQARSNISVGHEKEGALIVGGASTTQVMPNSAGSQLRTRFVVHALAPAYSADPQRWPKEDELLANCYKSALNEAIRNGCRTVAMPILSDGLFRGHRDLKEIVVIACRAIKASALPPLSSVYFTCATNEELMLVKAIAAQEFNERVIVDPILKVLSILDEVEQEGDGVFSKLHTALDEGYDHSQVEEPYTSIYIFRIHMIQFA